MPSKHGFQLTDGDIAILKLVFDYRILNIDHLIALTGRRHQMIHRRLLKLLDRDYLYRIRLPLQKHLYAIGKEAVPILVEQGSASKELIDQRMRHHELKELFLRHILMVVNIHAALELATRQSHIKLNQWKQGNELYDRVTIQEHGERQKLPVRPDAFFTLEDTTRPAGKNRAHFFLEADRSTSTHARFQKKIKAYWHYYEQGRHKKQHGIEIFRVLTITLTPERAVNLCEAAAEVLPQIARKFYFFTAMTNFSLTNPTPILKDIFMTPRDWKENTRYWLIPPQ